MNLTKNFTLEELTASSTAKKLGIDNTPSPLHLKNLERLASEILQPVRNRWGSPIRITSGYRCKELNKAVGGVDTSQHLTGEAADINLGKDNKRLFALMKKMVEEGSVIVGQLLDENGGSWIHVSLPSKKWKNDIRGIWTR